MKSKCRCRRRLSCAYAGGLSRRGRQNDGRRLPGRKKEDVPQTKELLALPDFERDRLARSASRVMRAV